MFNILTEPLIRVDRPGGAREWVSLPETYALLLADGVDAFPALRPHQRHAWHAFLVQLGAMALHRAGLGELPEDAGEWQRIIRSLTPDYPDDEPWQLVVEDITRPALMQPPARSAARQSEYKNTVATPDELDLLVTSKNHDLKSAVAAQAGVDDWLFALITLQTMEGYSGRYNYGISRMPSGYGNRSAFSLTPSFRPGAHVRHDLGSLLKYRQSVLDEYQLNDSGITLLWTIPWDGLKAEAKLITEMDAFYIEVCRRVRLCWEYDKLNAVRANSDSKRMDDVKGLTGDPWMPVSNNTNPRGTPPAFLGPRKFGYERVVDGLFSADWKRPILLSSAPSYGDMQLVARGMVRGEGGTAGYHERIVPLRYRTMQVFGRSRGIEELSDIARERIEQIDRVQSILRHAVSVFAAGGKTESIADEHRNRANPWANKLDEIVDVDFFDALQDEVESAEAERANVRNQWLLGVVNSAHGILRNAAASLPCPVIHRFKAQVRAEDVFWGRIRGNNGLPFLFSTENREDA